jgi:hypothetical protein
MRLRRRYTPHMRTHLARRNAIVTAGLTAVLALGLLALGLAVGVGAVAAIEWLTAR